MAGISTSLSFRRAHHHLYIVDRLGSSRIEHQRHFFSSSFYISSACARAARAALSRIKRRSLRGNSNKQAWRTGSARCTLRARAQNKARARSIAIARAHSAHRIKTIAGSVRARARITHGADGARAPSALFLLATGLAASRALRAPRTPALPFHCSANSRIIINSKTAHRATKSRRTHCAHMPAPSIINIFKELLRGTRSIWSGIVMRTLRAHGRRKNFKKDINRQAAWAKNIEKEKPSGGYLYVMAASGGETAAIMA